MKFLSYLLIIFGIFCCAIGGYGMWLHNDPNRLAFNQYTPAKVAQAKQTSTPQRIVISDLDINLPVVPAKITQNNWETTNDGASYLSSSPMPGQKGNSVIYAHNWASLFGNLVNAKPGQKVDVVYADGSKKKFFIEYTSTVSPNEASILAPSTDKRITLYTCTGLFDSKRFVVVAILDDGKPSFAKVDR